MHFDTALNIVWLLLGVLALASTLRVTTRVSASRKRLPHWLQLVGVASVVLALFPYISASDDVVRIANAQQTDEQHQSNRGAGNDLLRLYETVDAPLICSAYSLAVTFLFFCFVSLPVAEALRRSIPLQTGRSPPTSFASA